MRDTSVRSTFVLTLAIAAVISILDRTDVAALDQQPAQPAGTHAPPVIPARRTSDVDRPLPPPDLPFGANRIRALTIDITIQREAGGAIHTQTQTVSRTADHVHFSAANGREWLFQQNSRDPRRVQAYLIDHRSRTTVMHAESDLRMLMGIRGWCDILLLGLDVETLRHYTPSIESHSVAGLMFTRYDATPNTGFPGALWWSRDHLLAREFVTLDANGSTTSSITAVRPGVDGSLLRAPELRFPTYRLVNVADWLEHR